MYEKFFRFRVNISYYISELRGGINIGTYGDTVTVVDERKHAVSFGAELDLMSLFQNGFE